jgi:hypothetical protein
MTTADPSPARAEQLAATPWAGRSHEDLALLTRELLLCGHMIDRSGMPHLIQLYGREGMTQIAIEEWMGASPIYSKRMQRLLDFETTTVATICKNIQLDIGGPLEFLDFRFTVHDDDHAEFHLDHCGALMDVEPMGEEYVHAMCHTIEDPTFDATATASNPRAQVRPVHRPPRVPADRHPHCAWTITVVHDAEPVEFPAEAVRVSDSVAAQLPLASRPADLPDDDGANDYAGPMDPDLRLSRFSSATLAAIADEVALQCHLLSRAFLLPVVDRSGGPEAAVVGGKQVCGVAGLTTKRLAALLDLAPDLAGVAAVLAVHPVFLPRAYVDLRLSTERTHDGDALLVSLGPGPAFDEVDGLSWPQILVEHDDRGLIAAVQGLAPSARVARTDPQGVAVATWRVTIDPEAEPARQFDEVTLTEFSTGADFAFARPV